MCHRKLGNLSNERVRCHFAQGLGQWRIVGQHTTDVVTLMNTRHIPWTDGVQKCRQFTGA